MTTLLYNHQLYVQQTTTLYLCKNNQHSKQETLIICNLQSLKKKCMMSVSQCTANNSPQSTTIFIYGKECCDELTAFFFFFFVHNEGESDIACIIFMFNLIFFLCATTQL